MSSRNFFLASLGLLLSSSVVYAQHPYRDAEFVGSATCRECHEAVYDRWQNTLMANILVDVNERPEAILGDFSSPNPLVTFDPDEIDFTYGSKWKQRYFTRNGDDYFCFSRSMGRDE